MGQFAEGTVDILLCNEEDAKKVHAILSNKNVKEEISKFIGGEGHYEFFEFDEKQEGTEVYFKLSSGRVQNAEWQVEQIMALLKKLVRTNEISGVEEFSADIMVQGESYHCEGSEFEEGGDNE